MKVIKKTQIIMFVGLGVTVILLSSVYQLYANARTTEDINRINSNLLSPIYSTQDSKIYRLVDLNQLPEEIALIDGILSPDKTQVAYTIKKKNDWGIEPNIYIYNILNKSTNQIKIEDENLPQFVHSWSPDGSSILLLNNAQSAGEIVGKIYDYKSGKLIKVLDLYSYHLYWMEGNKIIYIEPLRDCSRNNHCIVKGIQIANNDLKAENKETIKINFTDNAILPVINDLIINEDILNILISTFSQIPSDEVKVKYEEKRTNLRLDLKDKRIQEVPYDDNFKSKIREKLPTRYQPLQIISYTTDPKDSNLIVLQLSDQYKDGGRLIIYLDTREGTVKKVIPGGEKLRI